MEILKISFIVLFVIYCVLMLAFALLEKRPIYTIIKFMVFGILVLVLINITSPLTKISLPVNLYTVLGSACMGVPGVITLLLLKIIFI